MARLALESRIAAALALHSPAEPALIGVSGGRDSVALLHMLSARGFEKLIVCHLDHALRAESARDAEFVREVAAAHRLDFAAAREDVAGLAKQRGQSVETAARAARYAFFARVACERDCRRLFLAHHADDQVETVLFNLFRGGAAGGLAGMRAFSTRTIDGASLEISRPLLAVWREEIDSYIAEHRLAFCDDVSNTDPQHTRNRLRHEIVPIIERQFGREIRRSIWRAAEVLRVEDDCLAELAAAFPLAPELDAAALRALPLALQRRVIFSWLKSHGLPDLAFDDVEAVRELLASPHAKVNLPGDFHARRRAKKLFIERPPAPGLSD